MNRFPACRFLLAAVCALGALMHATTRLAAADDPPAVRGRWFSAILEDGDDQERIATLDVTDGRYTFTWFVRDRRRLADAIRGAFDSVRIRRVPDGWAVSSRNVDQLGDDSSIQLTFDASDDRLTATIADQTLTMHRLHTWPAGDADDADVADDADDAAAPPDLPRASLTDAPRARWTGGLISASDSDMPHRRIVELRIRDDRFRLSVFDAVYDAEQSLLGYIIAGRYDGAVGDGPGVMIGERIVVRAQWYSLAWVATEPFTLEAYSDAANDRLVVVMPSREGGRVLHLFRPHAEAGR